MRQDAPPVAGPPAWFQCHPLVVSVTVLLSLWGLGAPAQAAGLSPEQLFPCTTLKLAPAGAPLAPPPQVLRSARGETHLVLLTLENAAAGRIDVDVRREPAPGEVAERPEGSSPWGSPAGPWAPVPPAWLEVQAFLVVPAPAGLPARFQADGLVPLASPAASREFSDHAPTIAVRLRVTHLHPPGWHAYAIQVRNGGLSAALPLRLAVWSFALPGDLPIAVFASKWETNAEWYARYGVEAAALKKAVIPASLAALRRYKVNGIGPFYPLPVGEIAQGTPVDDFPEFVGLLRYVTGALGFRRFRIPRLDGAETLGQPGSTFASRAVVYYGEWRTFLASLGLLERAQVKVIDEPAPELYPQVKEAYALIKAICPAFTTESAGASPPLDFTTVLDVWAHNLLAYDPGLAAEANRRGMKKWLYANRLHGIDHPPSHQRLIGWFLKQHRFDGYLLWSLNHWPVDPWTTLPGEEDAYRRGTFFYPDPATGLPWPTLRLEAWRRGLEDFQYFTLLEEAHHQGRVEASSYHHLMARLEALTADVATLNPRAAWTELEAVRLSMGRLLEAGSHPVGAPPAWERPQRGEPQAENLSRPRRARQSFRGAEPRPDGS